MYTNSISTKKEKGKGKEMKSTIQLQMYYVS